MSDMRKWQIRWKIAMCALLFLVILKGLLA